MNFKYPDYTIDYDYPKTTDYNKFKSPGSFV